MSNTSNITSPIHYQFKPIDSVFIILAVIIISLNSCVLFAMWRNKILQKLENVLLGSLAVSDLSTGVIGVPLLFACTFTSNHLCVYCYASFTSVKFISTSTVLHILAIITVRYLQVAFPFTYRSLISNSIHMKSIVIIVWLLSLTSANIPWVWWNIDCDSENRHYDRVYELTCFVVFFILPLLFTTFFLLKIFMVARRFIRRKRSRRITDPGKTARTGMRIFSVLLGMFLVFVVCWLPYFIIVVIDTTNSWYPEWLSNTAFILRLLTSVFNPLLYTFYKEDFYQTFKSEAQRLFCHRKNAQIENQNPLVVLKKF